MSNRLKKSLQVLGCLGIPLAFLFLVFYPIFANLRENTRATSCHTHLKNLGIAFSQYASDNDEAMPNVSADNGSQTWREALYPYVKSKETYHCPDRSDAVDAYGFSQNYAANDSRKGAFAAPGSAPITRQDYPYPSKLILLIEAENNPHPDFNIDDPLLFGPRTHKLWAGHFTVHGTYLMADGRAKSLVPSDTYLYDPKNHSLFNYWYRNPDTQLSPNGEAVLKETSKQFKWN